MSSHSLPDITASKWNQRVRALKVLDTGHLSRTRSCGPACCYTHISNIFNILTPEKLDYSLRSSIIIMYI